MNQHFLDINRRIVHHHHLHHAHFPDMIEDDYEDITRRTLHHYDDNARRFFAGTIDHDVSQNIAALLGRV